MTTKAVVFDLFGTLIPVSAELYWTMLHTMADAVGAEGNRFAHAWVSSKRELESGKAGGLDSSVRYVSTRLGITPTSSSVNQAVDAWLETSRRRLAPSHRTLECLETLTRRGHRIGLLSNCAADIPYNWPGGELARLVTDAGFSWTLGLMKPDRDAYVSVCTAIGVAPEDCVFVGDGGDRELTGAREAGLRPVLLEHSTATELGSSPTELSAFGSHSEAGGWDGERIATLESLVDLLSQG